MGPGTCQARAQEAVIPTRPTTAVTPPDTAPGRSDAYNCDDFPLPDGTTAQDDLRRYPSDPSGVDSNNDGVARETVREGDIDPKSRMTRGIQEGPPRAL